MNCLQWKRYDGVNHEDFLRERQDQDGVCGKHVSLASEKSKMLRSHFITGTIYFSFSRVTAVTYQLKPSHLDLAI